MAAAAVGVGVGRVAEVVGVRAVGEEGLDGWLEGGDPEADAALQGAPELVGGDGGGDAAVGVSDEPAVGVGGGGGNQALDIGN